jgi:hypothetical protein
MQRITSRYALGLMVLMSLGIFPQCVPAQSECAAANQNDDQICSVSCPIGQTASCKAGIGSSAPKCVCSGTGASPGPADNGYGDATASRSDGR